MIIKKASFIAVLAVALFALVAPGSAFAQEGEVDQSAPQEQIVEQDAAGNLIDALNNIDAQIEAAETTLEAPPAEGVAMSVVSVDEVAGTLDATQVETLNAALQSADTATLQAFLNENEVLNSALASNNVNLQDVVAIEVQETGGIVFYVQPQQ